MFKLLVHIGKPLSTADFGTPSCKMHQGKWLEYYIEVTVPQGLMLGHSLQCPVSLYNHVHEHITQLFSLPGADSRLYESIILIGHQQLSKIIYRCSIPCPWTVVWGLSPS